MIMIFGQNTGENLKIRGWCARVFWRPGMGGGLVRVTWVEWVVCLRGLRGWRASVGGMSGVLLVTCNCYFCYYYWNTILKNKMLNVYFWNKNEKLFQIDLNSDLKEKPDLKSIRTGNAKILNMPESAEICPNVGKYFSISVTKIVTLFSWTCVKYYVLK